MDTSPLRIRYCLSLSGALASNGKTARLAHQIWQKNVNARFNYPQYFVMIPTGVTFGEGGGWAQPRVLTVQFQNIESNNISEFKRPNTQVVVYPSETASASVIYPYAKAKR